MNNYDDLLREKENDDLFNDNSLEKHWEALEKKMDSPAQQPQTKYRKMFLAAAAVAAVLLVTFLGYFFLNNNKDQQGKIAETTNTKSAIAPPLSNLSVPYETFNFNATTGDTIFTLNGSIIIFPGHAVLNSRGEIVDGDVEVRTREFNDPFDYSIAGIPMDYDSAGTTYKFISSAMIDISAYQNGEPLQVNPAAKPQLNLVSTNKERKTSLYKLDTANGKWINKGIDEVNLVGLKKTKAGILTVEPMYADPGNNITALAKDYDVTEAPAMPAPPQKASNLNPVIDVIVDPASFKELLVYDGLKFEVTDAKAATVAEDSKTDWDNIELVRGDKAGTYKAIFSAKNRKAVYNVKPVLEGKDFAAAEKLYQEKLKEYSRIQLDRKARDEAEQKSTAKQIDDNKRDAKERDEDNKRIEELNKLVELRNKFIEAENIKIEAINKENRRRRDSAVKANNELAERQRKDFEKQMKDFQKQQLKWDSLNKVAMEKQQAIWEQSNRIAALEQNLIRSFRIDGFGYWNCDQPTLPQTQLYVSNFKTLKNELITYNTLCIATAGINRIQNYYSTKNIGLINNSSYFGWAFNETQFYYFTTTDFRNAVVTNNPNTISLTMTLYEGDLKNYNELKAYIFNVNNSNNNSKK